MHWQANQKIYMFWLYYRAAIIPELKEYYLACELPHDCLDAECPLVSKAMYGLHIPRVAGFGITHEVPTCSHPATACLPACVNVHTGDGGEIPSGPFAAHRPWPPPRSTCYN